MTKDQELRIVLFGVPLAGKTRILREASRRFSGSVAAVAVKGRGVDDAEAGLSADFAFEGRAFQLTTLPGNPWDPTAWEALLRGCDAVLVVIDPQTSRAAQTIMLLCYLAKVCSAPTAMAIQVTKMDLLDRGVPCIDPKTSELSLIAAGLRTFESREDDATSLSAGVAYLVSALAGASRA